MLYLFVDACYNLAHIHSIGLFEKPEQYNRKLIRIKQHKCNKINSIHCSSYFQIDAPSLSHMGRSVGRSQLLIRSFFVTVIGRIVIGVSVI